MMLPSVDSLMTSLTTRNRTAWPSCYLTTTSIFRDFTFPPLSREGTCHHSLTARHHGVITVVRDATPKQSSMAAQGHTEEAAMKLCTFPVSRCALPAAAPALVFPNCLTTPKGQTLPSSVFLSRIEGDPLGSSRTFFLSQITQAPP